jgi:hypothetical protein
VGPGVRGDEGLHPRDVVVLSFTGQPSSRVQKFALVDSNGAPVSRWR